MRDRPDCPACGLPLDSDGKGGWVCWNLNCINYSLHIAIRDNQEEEKKREEETCLKKR